MSAEPITDPLLKGIEREKTLNRLRKSIAGLEIQGRKDPDAAVAVRVTSLRRQHFDLTGCSGPS